jgi:hypothetical protein
MLAWRRYIRACADIGKKACIDTRNQIGKDF